MTPRQSPPAVPSAVRTDVTGMLDRMALAVAAAVVAAKPLYVHDPRYLAPSLIMMHLSALALILWLTGRVLAGRLSVVRVRVVLPLALMAVAVVIGLFMAEHRRPAVAGGCEWLSTLIAVFCLVQTVRDRAGVTILLAMLLATGLVVAGYGIHQYFIGLDQARAAYQRDPQGVLWRLGGIAYGTPMQARFEKRLADQAASGTFALSNSLAGYCLMLLPVGLGLFLDTVRRRGRQVMMLAAPAVIVTVLALAAGLALTRSKGGYAAGAIALAAFGVGGAWPWLRRYARVLVPAAAVLVVLAVGGVAWWVRKVGVEPALGPSMRFRVDYWTGGLGVIGERPFTGVGLDGFRDYYLRFKKPESPEEVHDPHNLVLGLWSATGPLGVAAFGWLLAAGLRSGRGGGSLADPSESPSSSRAAGPSGGVRRKRLPQPPAAPTASAALPITISIPVLAAAVVWMIVGGLVLQPLVFCLAGMAAWLAAALAVGWPLCLHRVPRAARPPVRRPGRSTGRQAASGTLQGASVEPLSQPPGRLLRVGLVAGVVGFAVHALIDLEVGVPALVATVLALLAMCGAAGRDARPGRTGGGTRRGERTGTPRWLGIGLLIACVVGTFWFARSVAQPFLIGEADFLQARSAHDASAKAVQQRDYAAAAAKLREAMALYRRSLENDPLNADARFALAQLAFDAWRSSAGTTASPEERRDRFERGLRHLRLAQELHPRRAQLRYVEAMVLLEAAKAAGAGPDYNAHIDGATRAANRLADDIYPTNVRYRLLRARIRERTNDRTGALEDYRAALEYDQLQRDDLLRLPDAKRRAVEAAVSRLGG